MFPCSKRYSSNSNVSRLFCAYRRSQRYILIISSLIVDNHDIISVESKTIYSSPYQGRTVQAADTGKQGKAKKGKGKVQPAKNLPKGDSFGMALLRVIGVLVIMGVLYFAWTAYRVRQGERW